jgi:hypothetical protein
MYLVIQSTYTSGSPRSTGATADGVDSLVYPLLPIYRCWVVTRSLYVHGDAHLTDGRAEPEPEPRTQMTELRANSRPTQGSADPATAAGSRLISGLIL